VSFLLIPLRTFEETAMAWSFSRPSAQRAARVLGLERTAGPATPGAGASGAGASGSGTSRTGVTADGVTGGAVEGAAVDGATSEAVTSEAVASEAVALEGAALEAVALEGDLRDPASGLLAPAGLLTAVVCGDPDAAGRLADRLGGHSPSADGAAEAPSATLGGVPLDGVPLLAARAAVLVQDKDPVLLSGTLRELLDVPGSGRVENDHALRAACCEDALEALTQAAADTGGDPMSAPITERGRSLSGGQRQRLVLARSLVADPPVLVLDEPTSAVDSHTEARIAEGLRRIRAGRTTVVFTSSPLLLDRADRVVFVDDGRAAATGTHRELLRADPRYRAVVTRETDEEARGGTASAAARDLMEMEETA
jgi:ABC-type hemin transport system ATPase subunit